MPTLFLYFSARKTHRAIQQDGNVYNRAADAGGEGRRLMSTYLTYYVTPSPDRKQCADGGNQARSRAGAPRMKNEK